MRSQLIRLVSADITRTQSDVVVLSANPRLIRGGVSGAIHKSAGPMLEFAAKALGPIEPGSAVITDAFDLSAKRVIHAVAPIFNKKTQNIDELFTQTYQSVLELNQKEAPHQSIVFPAIGSGIYGWPCARAARLAVSVLRNSNYGKTLISVIDRENYEAYAQALNDLRIV